MLVKEGIHLKCFALAKWQVGERALIDIVNQIFSFKKLQSCRVFWYNVVYKSNEGS